MNTPDPDAPLTPEEEWAYQQQGGYLRIMEQQLGLEGLEQAIEQTLNPPKGTQDSAPPPVAEAP